ncbi:phosphoribosylaminoimidazole carboxylase, ATPase subunit, variant [Verruconis gallopava]|uniref:Phosphoribosylaminoimidazole carboxylase n=1 Tax=Verruconis gallopava TaxID=253628 RepID=A0A0D2AVL4_9PEZI|nr:phosphoribosylaminoimidazole carboxylase, ATPase subunit, variant [Verruconis gallopava]KIW03189.1 phosphoribosylaminoimidazole carboxylase, ATPase subunit, variant [Verruconis gallopava]
MANRVVGVLGGGQLGRMLAEAANRMNIRVVVLDKEAAPAKKITNHDAHITGSFKSEADIQKLADISDVLTIEIEHVDASMLERMEQKGMKVEPRARTIATIQDKYLQKLHLINAGVSVAESIPLKAGSEDELKHIGGVFGYPFMLKTRKDAYDGRGNFPVKDIKDIPAAVKALGGRGEGSLYAERWAPFVKELAVMVINTQSGSKAFPVVETIHENSICKLVYAPARGVSNAVLRAAQDLARKAVSSFQGKGVYGVEMFLLPNNSLLINEIAPRPHNSGHYTIEACPLSQYDAHLRAILDLPIPDESLQLREPAIMLNILGGKTKDAHVKLTYDFALANPRTSVHLYDKGDGTSGRKMGHVTVTAKTMSECEALIAPLIHQVDILSGVAHPAPESIKRSPLVAVIMGSDSDLPTLKPGLQLLKDWQIPFTTQITSAHRTPEYMASFTAEAAAKGIQVIIAAAGGAAHLPGMAAAHTSLPVIGVPVKGSSLDGVDSLYSIVQMPRGVPVATVAINNSLNAALLAARILGVGDIRIREKVEAYAAAAKIEVGGKDKKLMEIGWEQYLKEMGK